MNIERRYSGGFDVYIPSNFGGNRTHIDTVYFTSYTKDEARRSLIDHDGYDSNIIVVPPQDGIIPLTERELESLCEDNEVTLAEGEKGWRWNGETSGGNQHGGCGFNTKEDAMRDAVNWLDLDTNGSEDDAE